MGAFDINGKLFKSLTKAGDFFILGFLTAVFCIPVITIGPSLTAADYVALKAVRDEEGYIFKSFWKAFKQNFRQGFIIELIMAVSGILLFFDIRASYQWGYVSGSKFGAIFMFVVIGVALIWAAVLLYVFAVLAQFENTVLATVRNALILCVHHLPQTFIMLILNGAIIFFSVNYFTAFIVTVPLLLYINAYILSRVFRIYIKRGGTTAVPKEDSKEDEESDEAEVSDEVTDIEETEKFTEAEDNDETKEAEEK